MADNISSVVFAGDRNQGFQLGNNSGHVHVDYHITQSGMLYYTLLSETVLISVCSYQRKNPSLVPVPPCLSGETTTLSIATRLLRYMHGVLNRLLE